MSNTITVTIRLMPRDTWRAIRAYAALHGMTTSQACIEAIGHRVKTDTPVTDVATGLSPDCVNPDTDQDDTRKG